MGVEVTLEIERKFLLREQPPDLEGSLGTPVRQGYLAIAGDVEVRLRDKGGRFFQAVKIGQGLVRREFQVELDRGQFDVLWPATEGRRVEKTRHRLVVRSQPVDVDVYHGGLEGLAVAEVEFASEEEASRFVAPSWFGTEVTDDPRYANRSLATSGRPDG